MTRHKFISKLFHIFMISLMVMQSLVYPWISLLPAPPGVRAQESPPVEATHSASTPAPSPLDPLLNLDTIFSSTTAAETIPPEEVPEATPSATPEPTPENIVTPSSTPSASVAPSPSASPTNTQEILPSTSPSPSATPILTDLREYGNTGIPLTQIFNPFSISLQYPFAGSYPTSYGFGQRSPNNYVALMQSLFGVDAHDGLDFAMPIGTEILSTSAGTIISAGSGLYGTTIQIEHSWGVSYYGHLSDTSVQAGDKVKAGQIIGYSGNSGVTTGPHLHFGILPVSPNLLNGYHGMIDPAPYLQGIILPKILGTKDGKAIQNRARVRQIKNKFSLAKNSLKNDDTSIKVNFEKGESSDLNIVLKNPKGFEIDITDQTLGTLTGPLGPSLDVNLTEVVDLVPGLYQLTITDALGNYETQDFSWGVLAINTNKTIYLPSTPVDFSMAVLDNQGDMVCDAQVDLSITSPSGLVTKLSSTTGEVTVNLVTCLSKTYTLNPDYQATFHPTELGNYEVNMSTTTADGTRSISSSFRVASSVPFDVERVTITRIYPRLDYPVILRVHAFEDFVGTVEDIIPASFELIKPAGDQNPEYSVSARGDTQVLSWNVVWQKGGDYVLSYQFNPPDKSPDFYTFGPLKIGNRFSEIKKWQLAIDVTTTIILNYAHTILTSGTTWTVPADWTDGDNTIEVIGGGGAGRTDTAGTAGAGGGGGGAYAKSVNIALTPGASIDYQIGRGGIATSLNGTDTFFNRTAGTAGTCADTTSVCAKGGTGATSATGAAGGLASASFATGTGNVKNNGGTGGTGNTTADSGGGGGGAGGPNGAGGTGGAGDTDNTTDGVGGGGGGNGGGAAGGSGITSDTIGAAGGNGNGGTGGGAGGTAADGANGTAGTGGGGGGGSDNMDGGHGANGSDLVAGVAVGSGGGGGGTGDTATTTGMGGNGGLYGGGGGGGRYGGFGAPGVIIITYNGNTPTKNTWVVPADWNSSDNTVTVIGGGGAGVSAAQGTGAAGGGGGGYSSISNLSLTPGANVDYQVGVGGRKVNRGAGAGTAGTASFFNRTAGTAGTCADTVSVCANPGAAGSGITGGAGGSTTGADGTTLLAGGAGGAGNSTGDTSGGGGGAGGATIGKAGGAGPATTPSAGGGGGGGAGGGTSSAGQIGQTTTGGTGGNGPAGTGGGTAGNAGHGGAGTAATGGGGGGGDDVFGGGAGGSGSSTTYGGGGGGGAGDNNTAATSQAYGGHGGLHGGAGGGGLTNGFGAEGIIIITYTPAEITIGGTANGNDGATVKWAKNGTVQASTATIGASTWTITAITPPPSSGDIITVWVDGATEANETTAVTKFTSGNISGMVLNTNVSTVGSNQDTSLSLTDLENYDCTQNEDIMYQAASSHLKIEGDACAGSTTNTYTSEKLEILSGDTMTVATSETVTTYDLTITGTLTSSGNSTYNVSHDWANTGTFTSSTSTVNLTGADSSTQTLSGSTSFNNLSASTSSNSAGRTITHTAGTTQTVTGTWTITGFTGKVITLGSSAASTWTINPAVASVDYATVSYSINTGTAFCATHTTDGGNNIAWSTTTGTTCVVQPAFEASATTDTTTTSATDVQMAGMTITPGAGDYVIQFSSSITGPSASSSTQYVSIYVNNVKIDHSEREVFTEESLNLGSVDAFPTTTQAYVSGVGASYAIEVRWRTTAPTATAHERVLTARRVDSADMSQATATADTTTTSTTSVQMDSMTLTPGAGDYLVQFSTSIAGPGTTDTTQLASLYVGGTKVSHTERRVLTEGSFDVSPFNSFPTSFQAFITNVGASDVIEVKWNTSAGTATAHERTLTIEKVANSTMTEATRLNSTTTTSTTDTQLTGMTLTPGAGDYIAMFSSTFEGNTGSTTQYASIYVDGSQITRSQREVYTEDSFPSTAIPTSTHIYLPGITASQVIEVKWNTTGGTATSYHSTLTLQKVSGNSVDAPADPTSLAQLTPADVTLATGDYHNATSIKFTVSASDPEASDTLYLCVEKDLVTRTFSYTDDSCGTGVSYSGSPVTLSVTISNQLDASQYHWHARVKDSAGNYSNWINYGANTESARDYGIITNAQVYETHSTVDITTTDATDVLLEDMTLTPGAGDFLVNFSSSITGGNNTPGSSQLVSIYVGGSQVAHTVRRIYTEASYDQGNSFPISTQAYISGVTSNQTIEIRWNTDAGSATSHERTLTVAKVNSANISQATATADTTTSSTSDVQMDSMTLTPGAGDYLVMFSTSITGPGPTSSIQYASIYVDGVQATHTLRRVDTTTSHDLGLLNSFPVTAQAYVPSVTAGQVIEVKWRTAAGTATGHERTLTIQKITSTNMAQATANSPTTSTSTTDVQMTDMTLTPGAGDYLIMFSSSLRGDTAQSTQIASIYVGGVRVDASSRTIFTETSFTGDYLGFATHAYVTGVGASDVIEVKWKTDAGTASAYNRTLTVRNVITTNTAPNSPTSLAQTTTGDVTIATGGWVSSTSIKFNVTATDTDNPDTLYLCIEKDLLGVGFSNTEDSCGTGVAYSGSGVTLTHTISSQTDASEYHWQARVKDAAGEYSSWVAYGANAESARDYGLDTTAPTGGTVYDGTGAGVDVSYSDSSLSTLSANWESISSDVSGLVKYEYSIGTAAGATDIKTWTDNSTTTSVTATGLTLQSSIPYYVNVRTTDGAGNVSTPISSNGQRVAPSISFTIAPAALTFSNLNFANSYTNTQATTLTTSTNAYNGYVIRAFTTDLLRSTDTLTTIADFSAGSYATPATWAGAETGFGYTSSDTTIGGANKFGTATLYAPFSHTGPGDIVADHTNTVSGSPVSNEVFTLTYKVKVPASQAAKSYAATVIYTATAQY